MIFKLAAAVLFTAIGAMIGYLAAEKLRRARSSCTAVGHMLQTASYLIGSRNDDVYAICRHFKGDEQLRCIGAIQKLPEKYAVGEDFHWLWDNAIKNETKLGDEEKEILLRFGSMLGRSDAQTQLREINVLLNELEGLSEMRRCEFLKKGRLYRTAGLLFGIMAGILVL